ncbi:MAG: Ig-like domain-containing protein [Gemmatimonadaceae bacterium]
MSGLVAMLACSGHDIASVGPPSSGPAVRYLVTLTPSQLTLSVGLSRNLTARVVDTVGATQNVLVEWTSLQPNIASVSAGTVTALSAGTANIVARYGLGADTATVDIFSEPVHLQVWPSAISAPLGDTVAFRAQLVTAAGVALGERTVSWAASDSEAITLLGDGRVEMRRVGDVDLIAAVGEMTATASLNVFASSVGSVTVNPPSASVSVGADVGLGAHVLDASGRPIRFPSVTWSTLNAAIATIDARGIVRGFSPGSVIITARSGAKSATATVNVESQPSSSITLRVTPDTIVTGYAAQSVATPRDVNGNPIGGRPIVYQSSDPAVATISSSGAVVGLAPGSTDISATCDGHVVAVKLTVESQQVTSIDIVPRTPSLQSGSVATLFADVKDQLGQSMPNSAVTWSSKSPTIATISPSGMVAGVALGLASVIASSAGVSSQADVAVISQAVASVQISPTAANVFLNQNSPLAATASEASGQTIAGAIFAWSVADSMIASVSPFGVVTGKVSGITTVTASSGGHSSSASIAVSEPFPVPVAAVTVVVNSSMLRAGEKTQAVATIRDANGNVLTGRPLTWSSAAPSLATASASVASTSGTIAALAPGSVTITATAEGVTGLATITVSPPPSGPVALVTVTAPASSLSPGQNFQLTVVLGDAQGNVLSGRSVAYSSSNTATATVSTSGLVLGVAAGTVTLSVTSEGITGTIALTVADGAQTPLPYAVTVTLNASALQIGQTTQGVAVVEDSLGNTLGGVPVTWSSSNTSIATVSASGIVTALAVGVATITAGTGGKTGSVPIVVTAPSIVASVTVTMDPTSLAVGQSVQASAIAKDARGNVISGAAFTWSVNSTSILTVSADGVVTAIAIGTAQAEATADGVTGSVAVTVDPPPAQLVVPAALPQVFLDFPYTPATGNTITVPAGGNLQNALNAAQRGDEVVLQAGATFIGNFTLPVKSGTVANGWITIRTDKLSQLPPEGTRVTPAIASLMPKILTPNSAPALATKLSASGYRIVGVEVSVVPSFTSQQFGIVWLGDGSSLQNLPAHVATDLVLDRVYVHGQATTDTRRCVSLNSARTQITDSYLGDCHSNGFDAQAIQGHNGPGPYKIVNNTLIASTENIAFGGGDPSITGMIPADIEIRRNYLYTPAAWKGLWLKKNLFELKAGQRILIEGNVLDGSWTDGQVGYAFMLKVANQSGGCTWCTTSDITIRYNYIVNAGAGVEIAGSEGSSPYPIGAKAARFSVQNNVMDKINVGIFTGDQRFFTLVGNPSDIEITNNTMTTTGYLSNFLIMERFPSVTRLAFNRNVVSAGAYGMLAQSLGEGTAALGAVAGGWQFNSNYLIGSRRAVYPPGTTFVSSLAAVPNGFGANQGILDTKIAGVIIP